MAKRKIDAAAAAIEALTEEEALALTARFNREAARLLRESPGKAVGALASALATVRTLTAVMRPEDVKAARKLSKIIAPD